jgi:Spy/CpxP family protein refolding chaperone
MENTKVRREAALLAVVVFVLGALVGGIATHVWTIHASNQQMSPHGRDQILTQMTRELDFTPEQLKAVTEIVDDTHAQMRTLYSPLDAPREQIRQKTRERIRAVLTPDQMPKFDDFLRRMDEARKKEEGR